MNQSPGSSFDIDEGDWFIVKFTFEDQGSGETFTARYFVPPET
jgi:hypothetical protein